MNRLIKNEFKKLFAKKTMYVLFIILIIFIIFNNIMCSIDFNSILENQEYEKKELAIYEEELENLDYKKVEDNSYYIDVKTSLDFLNLKMKYDYDSWQRNYIVFGDSDIYQTIWSINQNTYGIDKNEELLKEANKNYEKIKVALDSDNWKMFLEANLKDINNEIEQYNKVHSEIKDKKQLEQLEDEIEALKIDKQTIEWRLEKNIQYKNSFLSASIEEYKDAAKQLIMLKKIENKTSDEERNYKDCLKLYNTNLYYIENNINIDKTYQARDIMSDFNSNYGAFITIFSIIIAGTIVSSEFQKGTIKLLLTRPYKRIKILFAKYIVSIISIIIFILISIVAQYIVGGIIFGFKAYSIPIVEYDFAKEMVITMPVFSYTALLILSNLPMNILLTTFAFSLGTITMNSAVSIAIPILGNMVSGILTLFVEKIKIIKYFITFNWDFSVYLFGGEGVAKGLTPEKSAIICLVYFLIMIFLSTIAFKKRDIKNI